MKFLFISTCLFASAFSAEVGFDNFGHVRVPSIPDQVEEEEEKTYNVFMMSTLFGNYKMSTDELAVELSKMKYESGDPMFNLTVLTSPDHEMLKMAASPTLRSIEFDTKVADLIDSKNPFILFKHENDLMDQIFH